jgi:hypothetical protein
MHRKEIRKNLLTNEKAVHIKIIDESPCMN